MREKKNLSSAAIVISDQQPSDPVSWLTNRWFGLKFGISIPDFFVVDLNDGDQIRSVARYFFKSPTTVVF